MVGEFSIKAVSRLTGITVHNLYAWERRYKVVDPVRSDNGRRIYTDKDIRRLKLLAELVRAGNSIGVIAKYPDKDLISLAANHKSSNFSVKTDSQVHIEKIIDDLIDCVSVFDMKKLQSLLAKTKYMMSPKDFVFWLIPQLMGQVGEQIEKGKMTIAQEHTLSDIIKHDLKQTFNDLLPLEGTNPKPLSFAISTPEGHFHDFGITMAAIMCRFKGHYTHFMGPNIPATSFAEAAKLMRLNGLICGLSYLSSQEERVRLKSFFVTLEKELPPSVGLWVGGPGTDLIQRSQFKRDVYIFETLDEFERKL